jgi:hypothetical protein
MIENITNTVPVFAGLLDSIIEELGAKDRREHERRMKELQIIENSNLRDEYVQQLLLDRMLYPIEKAQHDIQTRAKHAQWLAHMITSQYKEHGLTKEQAIELSQQFRLLAIQITNIDTLHELRLVYAAVTMFVDRISFFKHKKFEESLEYSIRKKILNPLNTCIATQKNFELRLKMTHHQITLPSKSTGGSLETS